MAIYCFKLRTLCYGSGDSAKYPPLLGAYPLINFAASRKAEVQGLA